MRPTNYSSTKILVDEPGFDVLDVLDGVIYYTRTGKPPVKVQGVTLYPFQQ